MNFEEINLRSYVRYNDGKQWKRGVVFFQEIVPKYAVAFIANTLFDERYTRMSTAYELDLSEDRFRIAYHWKKGQWNSLHLTADPTPLDMDPGSEEEFIAEHYWGYSGIDAERSSEYKVEHPSWQLYRVHDHKVEVDFVKCFGQSFAFLDESTPSSVFLAEGSELLLRGRRVIDRTGT